MKNNFTLHLIDITPEGSRDTAALKSNSIRPAGNANQLTSLEMSSLYVMITVDMKRNEMACWRNKSSKCIVNAGFSMQMASVSSKYDWNRLYNEAMLIGYRAGGAWRDWRYYICPRIEPSRLYCAHFLYLIKEAVRIGRSKQSPSALMIVSATAISHLHCLSWQVSAYR